MSADGGRVVSLADARAARAAGGAAIDPALEGLAVFERGWLSSNNLLIHDPAGAVLVDSSHTNHGDQTVALVQAALRPHGGRLAAVLNTHLHSDHCGGNAALQAAWPGVPVFVPAGAWDTVQPWDAERLSWHDTGQRCARFTPGGTLRAGETLRLGGRDWAVIAAPGHDPDAVLLFDGTRGVLVAGDALWENGFGVVFPELDGIDAFDQAAQALDAIERLPVSWVVPGHGAPFRDVRGALVRARSRLASWRADPPRHTRHAAKVLVKYHLLEEQRQSVAKLHLWAGATPLMRRLWTALDHPGRSVHAWCDSLIDELVAAGAACRDGDTVVNA